MRILLFVVCALALLELSACHSGPSQASNVPLSAAAQRGETTFKHQCSVCHYADRTDPLHGPGLKGLYKHPDLPSGIPVTDEHVRENIERGRKMMPPFGNILDQQQIDDVIAYLKTL